MKGLRQVIVEKTKRAEEHRAAARRPATDPRRGHEMLERAEELEGEVTMLKKALNEAERCMRGIENGIRALEESGHHSRCRNLAITNVEQGLLWLRREVEG